MSKNHDITDHLEEGVIPGKNIPGTTKLSRRDVLRNAGKAAYAAPVLTILSLLPSAAAAGPPSFPGTGSASGQSQNKKGKSRTRKRQ